MCLVQDSICTSLTTEVYWVKVTLFYNIITILGANHYGQLGVPSPLANIATPTYATIDDNALAKSITAPAAIAYNSAMLSRDSKVYFAGNFGSPEVIGDNTDMSRFTGGNAYQFTRMSFSSSIIQGKKLLAIATEAKTILVISDEGKLYGWGLGGM